MAYRQTINLQAKECVFKHEYRIYHTIPFIIAHEMAGGDDGTIVYIIPRSLCRKFETIPAQCFPWYVFGETGRLAIFVTRLVQ